MSATTRILCPVDFSESAQTAFEYAEDFASRIGAELILLHAFEKPISHDRRGQSMPADPAIAERLQAIPSQHKNLVKKRMLHAGPAADVICWAAEDQACDLIIMGTHGRTGLKHLLFGSTAENVLRQARCPVLTIRSQETFADALQEPLVVPPIPAPPFRK